MRLSIHLSFFLEEDNYMCLINLSYCPESGTISHCCIFIALLHCLHLLWNHWREQYCTVDRNFQRHVERDAAAHARPAEQQGHARVELAHVVHDRRGILDHARDVR